MFVLFSTLTFIPTPIRAQSTVLEFETLILSEDFVSEGACFADIDGDGHQDVVSGPYWYAGPQFKKKFSYMPGGRMPIVGYSGHFFSFSDDFNGDGRPDILVVPMPGTPSSWYENPGVRKSQIWKRHPALSSVDGESPEYLDLNGDGKKELVCAHKGAFGYAEPSWNSPEKAWTFIPATENRRYGRFTHGLGIGDVNQDGRMDLLETHGWWEQTETKGEQFKFHRVRFAQAGGAQMYTYDFDGDGDNDVLSTQNAHAYGLSWFENMGTENGGIRFQAHPIITQRPEDNPYGLVISQMHAVCMEDMDGDGIQDIITGKRYWAHNGHDPGAQHLPVLYCLRTVRSEGKVKFIPWLIEERAGVGTQVMTGDLNGDKIPDVLVGNKIGTFVHLNKRRSVEENEYKTLAPKPRKTRRFPTGTSIFSTHVRETPPLSPQEELKTFNVPKGFQIQLVASEPQIAKPMNLAFDQRGRLWVTSTVEYPYPAKDPKKARDKIIVLDDFDDSGRARKITDFATGLNIPIGLLPYQNGVICFSIPNIWFLKDTDGDGKADQKDKLYGPIGWERDTHGMLNSFTQGLDGWIYSCHGFNNLTQVAGRDGHQISMRSGNTFRFLPNGQRVEHFTFGQVNPFGMTFDHYGDFFTADCHTKPVSLLLEGGHHESFGAPHDGIGFIPNVMNHLHGSTAIGGIALGCNAHYPPPYDQSSFGGNVMTSRVNRNTLNKMGSSIRAQEEPDFVFSGDPWFRPVDLKIGTDGAVYIADFYNRIIGHYEVPLAHPGRDRHRGRIWRVVYTGSDARTHNLEYQAHFELLHRDLSQLSFDELVEGLGTSVQTRSSLIVERLVQEFGKSSLEKLKSLVNTPEKLQADPKRAEEQARRLSHLLWILDRLKGLEEKPVRLALKSENSLRRVQAFRLLGRSQTEFPEFDQWILDGFKDSDAMVRRSSVQASTAKPRQAFVRPLLAAYHTTPGHDVHLKHSLKIALRDHLKNEQWFRSLIESPSLNKKDLAYLAELSLALKTSLAGEFLVDNLGALPNKSPQEIQSYLRFAVRHVSAKSVDKIVALIKKRYAKDWRQQLSFIGSVRDGLNQKGVEIPESLRNWGIELSKFLLDSQSKFQPISWTYKPYPAGSRQDNPFVLTTRRTSTDGMKNTPLFSSIVKGEQRTGLYRSGVFSLSKKFSFYLAGHDGFPDQKHQKQNRVLLRLANTHQLIHETLPPRNDTAHRIEWNTSTHQGQLAYVEIIDGDKANAFAWLAVGRFSITGLNPSETPEKRRFASQVITVLKLKEMIPALSQTLLNSGGDRSTAQALARSLVQLRPHPLLQTLAESLTIDGLDQELAQKSIQAISENSKETAHELLVATLKLASSPEQNELGTTLSKSREGIKHLVELIQEGKLSARVLQSSTIKSNIKNLADDKIKKRAQTIIEELPDEDEMIAKLLQKRRKSYLAQSGSITKGKELFKTHCMSCHQVAGEGEKIAPNLDGIGNRGLNRVLEDVLAPNRNVDVAFRTTSLVTRQGKALIGLYRRTEGAVHVFVDTEGKEFSVADKDILNRELNTASLMPEDFGTKVSDEQFTDLMSYLLSLRNS